MRASSKRCVYLFPGAASSSRSRRLGSGVSVRRLSSSVTDERRIRRHRAAATTHDAGHHGANWRRSGRYFACCHSGVDRAAATWCGDGARRTECPSNCWSYSLSVSSGGEGADNTAFPVVALRGHSQMLPPLELLSLSELPASSSSPIRYSVSHRCAYAPIDVGINAKALR